MKQCNKRKLMKRGFSSKSGRVSRKRGKYFEELLNNSSDLLNTSNIPDAPQDLDDDVKPS